MPLRKERLTFHNTDMKYVFEPGVFETMVGPCSQERHLQEVILRVRTTSLVHHPQMWSQVLGVIEGDQTVCCHQNSAQEKRVGSLPVARQQQTYRPESPYSHPEIYVANMSPQKFILIES